MEKRQWSAQKLRSAASTHLVPSKTGLRNRILAFLRAIEKRQCQAFVEGKGERCQKRIRWGKKYCWWHYPKGGLIFGAFLGLILTLVFTEPLRRILSPHWPFHYLDGNAPMIVALSPDVRTSECIEPNTFTFSVSCRDDCSGLDLNECAVNLFHLKGNVRQPLSGKGGVRGNGFELVLAQNLVYGEYVLQVSLRDKAKNIAESEYPFVVPENDIMAITASYEDYDEAKHEKLLHSLSDKSRSLTNRHDLYVYHYVICNKGENTYCRNVHASVDNEGAIFTWQEVGGLGYVGVASLSISESMDRSLPKNRVFVSQQVLRIEEISPRGQVYFIALVGFMRDESLPQELRTPREVRIFGTYVSEGYGRTTTEKIRRWIPMKKLESTN